MFTELFRIEGPWPGQLAISARPRGGDWLDEEMIGWRRAGIDIIVSLLEPAEIADLGLENEAMLSEKTGIQFFSFPIVDRNVPTATSHIHRFLGKIDANLTQGKNVAVHCRQGIGRAGLMAAALLIEKGLSPEAAIGRVSAVRRVPIPETAEQRLWIESFAATASHKP
jgi:protein-tyrosine phosphatase